MNVLVAIDGSTHSSQTLRVLQRLPLARRPNIHIAHVVEKAVLVQPGIARAIPSLSARETKRADAAARRLMRSAAAKLRRLDPRAMHHLERGPVSGRLITVAEQAKIDLLVMGSRGLSNVQAFLMGSVSQQVATYAPCSMLVVKGKPRPLKRLLLATDGSASSEQAVSFLMTHLKPAGLAVSVLTVRDAPLPASVASMEKIEDQTCRRLSKTGFRATPYSATGHAAAKIIGTAKRQRADLVVVGSRGLTGLQRFLLGSVSRQVMKYCPAPVLIVRSRRRG